MITVNFCEPSSAGLRLPSLILTEPRASSTDKVWKARDAARVAEPVAAAELLVSVPDDAIFL